MLNDHWQWRHGPFLYEQVIRVPMVWYAPDAPGGRVVDGLAESVDILPTLLDLVGIEAPAGVQGRSMAPVLLGASGGTGRDSVLVQDRESPELLARGIDPTGFKIVALRNVS